jgi:hypothetical protein
MANSIQRQQNEDRQVVEERQQLAILSKNPKTLFNLWVEYQTGCRFETGKRFYSYREG